MLLVLLGILWHVFPVTSMILLAPFGRKWEGFYTSLLFGPVGLIGAILLRRRLLRERQEEEELRRWEQGNRDPK